MNLQLSHKKLPMQPKKNFKKERGKKEEKKKAATRSIMVCQFRFETEHLIQDHILFLQGNEYATHQCFFFGVVLCYSQRGHDPKENLVLFGYKLNMRVNFLKHPFMFLATYLNHV
jgi:hypothetical protein